MDVDAVSCFQDVFFLCFLFLERVAYPDIWNTPVYLFSHVLK